MTASARIVAELPGSSLIFYDRQQGSTKLCCLEPACGWSANFPGADPAPAYAAFRQHWKTAHQPAEENSHVP